MTNRILSLYNSSMTTLLLLLLISVNTAHAKELMVFAAASLSDSLTAVAKKYEFKHKSKIILSFDASSRLAKQIEQGAPADLYFSADKRWNTYLESKKIISKEMSQDLLSNKLVLISPLKKHLSLSEVKNLPLVKFKQLALAHENVPAGKYATEVLKKLAIYDALKPRIVTGDNVRNVLAWVARDEADLGIVFATDAKVEPKVKVIVNIDPSLHSEIIYPLSIIKHSPEAQEFFLFCQSPEAKAIFKQAGFDVLEKR